MEKIAGKYGLDLDDKWNIDSMPHQGRHPNLYHDFVESGMERAAREAGDDKDKFLILYGKYVKDPVKNNPDMFTKNFWK